MPRQQCKNQVNLAARRTGTHQAATKVWWLGDVRARLTLAKPWGEGDP